jgi:alanine racemase
LTPRCGFRPAWAEVDLSAVADNTRTIASLAAPSMVCAVVKADGYGHGAVEVARVALDAGAEWLAVALVEEGLELRAGGLEAPVLTLSEPPAAAMREVVSARLTPTVYTWEGLGVLRDAVRAASLPSPFPVHVKVDTGMHRVGAPPERAVELASAVAADPALTLDGFWTHFAVSDQVDDPFTSEQTERFLRALADLARTGVRPRLRHAANSAAAIWHPGSRFDMVRCGIALYGLLPALGAPAAPRLRPAMSLKAAVSYVKQVNAGERISYGLRYRFEEDSVVATVPLGYADGVTRSLGAAGGQVLIRGRRLPIAGTVTMDQVLVDCGRGSDVSVGDEAVLIGSQGDETIGAWDWAAATGTIPYEVVCGIRGRVRRVYRP